MRKALHTSQDLSLSLHSFLPPAVYDWLEDADHADVAGRVTDDGWGVAVRGHGALVWRVQETDVVVSYELGLHFPSSSPALLTFVPTSPSASLGDLLVLVSDDGHLSWWREPLSSSASAAPPSAPIAHLSLVRDETCACVVALPPSTSAQTSLVIGTSRGRLFCISLSLSSSAAPVVESVSSSSAARRGLLSSLASFLPWPGAAPDSDGEVLSLVWWRSEQGEGVWTLSAAGVKQWKVDQGLELLWSSSLAELADEGETIQPLAMTSSSSELYVLYRTTRRDDEEGEGTAHVAVFPVDFSADDGPFESYSAAIPLPSALSAASHIGVSQREDVLVYAWSSSAVAQLNVSNLSIPPSSFAFPSSLILGGGMLVDRAAVRLGSRLPAGDHAHCLLLCASYGVVQAEHRRDDSTHLSSVISSLDLAESGSDSSAATLSVAFHLYRHGQTKAASTRIDRAWEDGSLPASGGGPEPSPGLDDAALEVGKAIVDGHDGVGGVGEDSVPLVLSAQLSAKQQTLTAYLTFLHELRLYRLLSASACFTLLTYAEQLSSMVGLRHLLNSFPVSRTRSDVEYLQQRERAMVLVMEGCLERRGVKGWVRRGASVSEAFFTRVSEVADVFESAAAVLQTECAVEASDSVEVKRLKCYALQALNTVIDTLLSESARYRADHLAVHALPPSAPPHTPWTFAPGVRRSLEFYVQFLGTTIFSIASSSTLHALRIDLFQFLLRISRSLLLDYAAYTRATPADSSTGDEYRRVRAELVRLVRQCLPADQGSRVDVVYELAAEFEEFASIVSMAEDEDEDARDARLSRYLVHFGQPFARVLFDAYHAQHRTTRLFRLHQPAEYEGWLLAFLADHPESQWVQQVVLGQWEEASSTLMHVAAQGQGEAGDAWTWSHQKTLWSLGKLALLCSDAPDSAALGFIEDQLSVSTAQAVAAQSDPNAPLLPADELVNKLLSLPHTAPHASASLARSKQDALEREMTPYLLAVDVLSKAQFPWTAAGAASSVPSGEELLLLERLWMSLYEKDSAELHALSARRSQQVSDAWVAELRSTHLFEMWRHLRLYVSPEQRARFELSYEHFVKTDVWTTGEESRTETQHMRQMLIQLQQTALR